VLYIVIRDLCFLDLCSCIIIYYVYIYSFWIVRVVVQTIYHRLREDKFVDLFHIPCQIHKHFIIMPFDIYQIQ